MLLIIRSAITFSKAPPQAQLPLSSLLPFLSLPFSSLIHPLPLQLLNSIEEEEDQMDTQRSPLLTSWAYFCHGKNIEELRHSLLCTTLDLENTKLIVQDELRKRDDQLIQLKELLDKTIKERDEAHEKCQKLLLENLLIQQQKHVAPAVAAAAAPLSGVSSIEDEPRKGIDSNNGFSSSDCDESIVSSPVVPQSSMELDLVLPDKPLPEKGKLLQAVMKAGPLLQTLLLAGPLPQWRHPPPPLESFQIPPVTIASPPPPLLLQDPRMNCSTIVNCSRLSKKRGVFEGSKSPTETKYQRIILN